MTEKLREAVAAAEHLPVDVQDALAARLWEEIVDEQAWQASFARTSDREWDRMAERVRRDVAAGATHPLDDVLPVDDSTSR